MMAKATRLIMVVTILASLALTAGAGIKWDNTLRVLAGILGY